MAKYMLADLVVELCNRYPHLENQCRPFLCEDSLPADITVAVTPGEIVAEQKNTGGRFSPGYTESICAYRKLCLELPRFNGLFLHSSVIRFRDRGIGFLAPSGTGKTTHTALWQQLYGDEIAVINGDKPLVRFLTDVPTAYGTPWAGKEKLYQKDRVTLTDLCFIERSRDNSCTPLSPQEALTKIVHQVILPKDALSATQTLDLLDRLLRSCRLWKIRCNTSPDAAKVASKTIMK